MRLDCCRVDVIKRLLSINIRTRICRQAHYSLVNNGSSNCEMVQTLVVRSFQPKHLMHCKRRKYTMFIISTIYLTHSVDIECKILCMAHDQLPKDLWSQSQPIIVLLIDNYRIYTRDIHHPMFWVIPRPTLELCYAVRRQHHSPLAHSYNTCFGKKGIRGWREKTFYYIRRIVQTLWLAPLHLF